MKCVPIGVAVAILATIATPKAYCSSHREAPGITGTPKLDATDFYMFRSYEPGKDDKVVFVANYCPLQAPFAGPNYFFLDEDAKYAIHVDADGDAKEDFTFSFQFNNVFNNVSLLVDSSVNVTLPLLAVGQVTTVADSNLNLIENYSLNLITGDRDTGPVTSLTHDGDSVFVKPFDYAGTKTFPDYPAYAAQHIYTVEYPGGGTGRVFVGQRADPFVVNLGEVFDLVNIQDITSESAKDSRVNVLKDSNVTSFIMEVPISYLTTNGANPIIGAWTTCSKGGVQMSRLGNPLVNELVIGVDKKDTFNASEPRDDVQFADFVTHPTFPILLEILFGSVGYAAPTTYPRTDLISVFLTGVEGLNKPAAGAVGEVMRLNTAIVPTARESQSPLAVLGGDAAGYPNGRRPGDDVVDITLRVASGALLPLADAPSGQLPLTDGAYIEASMFSNQFPFLNTPKPGAPGSSTFKGPAGFRIQ